MEESTERMDASENALAASKELTEASSMEASDAHEDAGSTFVPVLRQMGDGAKEDHQAVCGGSVTGLPKVGLTYGQCAHACDAEELGRLLLGLPVLRVPGRRLPLLPPLGPQRAHDLRLRGLGDRRGGGVAVPGRLPA